MSQNTQLRVGRPGGEGRILYDDGSVKVTSRWLIVDGMQYDLRLMRHLRTVYGPRSPLRVNAGIAVGVILVVIAMTARYLDSKGWIGAGLVLLVPMAIWGLAAVNSQRASELWCEYKGFTVQALWVRGSAAYRYGQIVRAINRAREDLGGR